MNTSSSRSHAIFTLELKTFFTQTETVHTSQLSIVDLAGSERSRTNTADRLAEAGSINRSLMVLGQCIEGLRNSCKSSSSLNHHTSNGFASSHGGGIVIPFRQNKLTEMLFGNAILKRDTRAVMIVCLSRTTAYEENVGILRYASLAHEIEALPPSELGASVSRSSSGEVRAEEGTCSLFKTELTLAEWNERLAQMEFMLREEECKRLDADQKLALLEHEMIQQALEMEEKLAEMEKMYMYRLVEEVSAFTMETYPESTIVRSHGCEIGYYGCKHAIFEYPRRSCSRTKGTDDSRLAGRESLVETGIGESSCWIS